MPTVQLRPDFDRWLYDAACAYLTRRKRTGVHVSDLISPRKAYFARIIPKRPTDREIGYFLAGRAHEEAVMAVTNLGRSRKIVGEWGGLEDSPYSIGDGIRYEVDAVVIDDAGTEVPTELKTNRRPTVLPPEQVLEEYEVAITQLGMYVASLNRGHVGYLLEFHLMARNLPVGEDATASADVDWAKQSSPLFVTYQVNWSEAELDTIRRWMAGRRFMLENALEARDHTLLPECHEWMCGREETKFEDPRCPRCGTIYVVGEIKPDGKKRGVLKKCETCKEEGKRLDLIRPSQTVFLATCRWFKNCLPSQWSRHFSFPKSIDTGQEKA